LAALRAAPAPGFPELRLLEDERSVTVVVRVPGFAREDLSISVQRDWLDISGRARQHVPEGFSWLRQGRVSRDFSCRIELSPEVASFGADARVDQGLLTVRLQKQSAAGGTLIPIRAR
jgi:HSP20 family protein